jgi:DNA repair protein RadC
MNAIRRNGMRMSEWPAAERPTERMLECGPTALSDAELLAIILRTGTKGKTALDLGRALLRQFGSLGALLAAEHGILCRQEGLGLARCGQFRAMVEIMRRTLREDARTRSALTSPGAVRDYLCLSLRDLGHEVFMALYLDAQNRVIGDEELFRGTLTQTSVYPREVVKRALARNAAALILAHNHPSGVAEPSGADEALTRVLKQALALIDVKVLDHFVIAGNSATSFAERGLL